MNETDRKHLERCVELAEQALSEGNAPFGSLIVSADGDVLHEDYNRTGGGDLTRHPEFALARWAAEHLPPAERAGATVYTSGEHCPMCAAAHGFVGLGRIVYAGSSEQLGQWRAEFGVPSAAVRNLPIADIIVGAVVEGPEPSLSDRLKRLHRQRAAAQGYGG